jgi:hypothetical protein
MNILQRLPQSTKILIVGLLLIAAVTTWYLAIFRPSQQAVAPEFETSPPASQPIAVEPAPVEPSSTTSSPQASSTASTAGSTGTSTSSSANATAPTKPLEVLPVPFLAGETPSSQPSTSKAISQPAKPVTAAAPRPRIQVPPNPFVPLVVEEPLIAGQTSNPSLVPPAASTPVAQTTPSVATPVATPSTIPVQRQQVQVRQPVAQLPRASIPQVQVRNAQPLSTPRLSSQTPPTTVSQSTKLAVQVAQPKPVQPKPRLTQPTTRVSTPGQLATGLGSGALPIRLNPLSREVPILPPLLPAIAPELSQPVTVQEPSKPVVAEPVKPEPPAPNLSTAEPPASATKPEPVQTVKPEPQPATVQVESPVKPEPVVSGADQGVLQNSSGEVQGLDPLRVELKPQILQGPEVRRTAPTPVKIEPPQGEAPKTETKPEATAQTKPEATQTKPQNQASTAETKAQAQTVETKPVVETPITRYVREQGLRLTGVVLGPTSVAIFQFKNGEYMVLPVGATLPDSEILLKSLNAREALLVQGKESQTLELQQTN